MFLIQKLFYVFNIEIVLHLINHTTIYILLSILKKPLSNYKHICLFQFMLLIWQPPVLFFCIFFVSGSKVNRNKGERSNFVSFICHCDKIWVVSLDPCKKKHTIFFRIVNIQGYSKLIKVFSTSKKLANYLPLMFYTRINIFEINRQ